MGSPARWAPLPTWARMKAHTAMPTRACSLGGSWPANLENVLLRAGAPPASYFEQSYLIPFAKLYFRPGGIQLQF